MCKSLPLRYFCSNCVKNKCNIFLCKEQQVIFNCLILKKAQHDCECNLHLIKLIRMSNKSND